MTPKEVKALIGPEVTDFTLVSPLTTLNTFSIFPKGKSLLKVLNKNTIMIMQNKFNINKDTRIRTSGVDLMSPLLTLNKVKATFCKSMFYHFSTLCMKVLI